MHSNILDSNYDMIVDMISDAIQLDKPKILIENNGIGFYEYGSATGFDAGQDIPYIDDDIIELPVKLPFSKWLIPRMVDYFNNGGLYSSCYDDLLNDNHIQVNYSVIKAIAMKDGIKFVIKFTSVK